jgi:hypothetical protein
MRARPPPARRHESKGVLPCSSALSPEGCPGINATQQSLAGVANFGGLCLGGRGVHALSARYEPIPDTLKLLGENCREPAAAFQFL